MRVGGRCSRDADVVTVRFLRSSISVDRLDRRPRIADGVLVGLRVQARIDEFAYRLRQRSVQRPLALEFLRADRVEPEVHAHAATPPRSGPRSSLAAILTRRRLRCSCLDSSSLRSSLVPRCDPHSSSSSVLMPRLLLAPVLARPSLRSSLVVVFGAHALTFMLRRPSVPRPLPGGSPAGSCQGTRHRRRCPSPPPARRR